MRAVVWRTLLSTMKRSGDSTHHCRSPTPTLHGCVEFALHPQHEASCDSEIQTKKVLKRKFREQFGRLSIILLNNKDKEGAFESQG